MYLASNLPHMQTFGKVHGNFHVPCNETHFKVHGNFHVPCNGTYGKVHGNFHVPCDETYGKVHGNFQVPCNETYGKVHGNFHVPVAICFIARLQTKHMTKHSLPYVSLQGTLSLVLRKSIPAAQRDIDISVDLH